MGLGSLCDWNNEMDEAVLKCGRFEVGHMCGDGIHSNIFGNLVLSTSLLNHIDAPTPRYNTIRDEFQKLLDDDNNKEMIQLDSMQLDSMQLDKIIDIIMKLPMSVGL